MTGYEIIVLLNPIIPEKARGGVDSLPTFPLSGDFLPTRCFSGG